MADGFFSPGAGQQRRQWLNEKSQSLGDVFDYFLGPTGVPGQANAVNELFNPVVGVRDSMAQAKRVANPNLSPQERALSALGAGAEVAGVVAPAAALRIAKVPMTPATAGSALSDSLAGIDLSPRPDQITARPPRVDDDGLINIEDVDFGDELDDFQWTPEQAIAANEVVAEQPGILDEIVDEFEDLGNPPPAIAKALAPEPRSSRRVPKPVPDAKRPVGADQRPRTKSGDILDDRGFYSPTKLAIHNLKRESGPWHKMRQTLLDSGAKVDELKWLALDKKFHPDQRVTRQELLEEVGRFGDPVTVRRAGGEADAQEPNYEDTHEAFRRDMWDQWHYDHNNETVSEELADLFESNYTQPAAEYGDHENLLLDLGERIEQSAPEMSLRERRRAVWNTLSPREQQDFVETYPHNGAGRGMLPPQVLPDELVEAYFSRMFSDAGRPTYQQPTLPGIDPPYNEELTHTGRDLAEYLAGEIGDGYIPADRSGLRDFEAAVDEDGLRNNDALMDDLAESEYGRGFIDEVQHRMTQDFEADWDADPWETAERYLGEEGITRGPPGTSFHNPYFSQGFDEYYETSLTPKYKSEPDGPYGQAYPEYPPPGTGVESGRPARAHEKLGENNIGWSRTGTYPGDGLGNTVRVVGEMQSDQQQKVRKLGLKGTDSGGQVPEQPYVTKNPATLQRRLIREELKEAIDNGDDYFAFPDAQTILDYTGGRLSGHKAAYEEMAPNVLQKVLSEDLGLKVNIENVPYSTHEGEVTGKGIRLTPAIREAIRTRGLPYFGIPAAGAGLGGMMGEEYEKEASGGT